MIHARFCCNHDPLLRSSSLVVREARGGMSVSVSSHERNPSRGTRSRATSPRTVMNHAGQEPVGNCHSSRGEREAGRCAAAGPRKPEAYSLEYRCGFFGTEKNVDARPSFAAVEWSCRTDSYGYSRLNSSMTCPVISSPSSLYRVGPPFPLSMTTCNPRRFDTFPTMSPTFSRNPSSTSFCFS